MRCSLSCIHMATLWRCRKTQIYFYVLFPFYHQLRFSCFKGRDNLERTQGRLQIDTSAIFNSSMSGLAYKMLSNMMCRLISLVNLTGCRITQETCLRMNTHKTQPVEVGGSTVTSGGSTTGAGVLTARRETELSTLCFPRADAVWPAPHAVTTSPKWWASPWAVAQTLLSHFTRLFCCSNVKSN